MADEKNSAAAAQPETQPHGFSGDEGGDYAQRPVNWKYRQINLGFVRIPVCDPSSLVKEPTPGLSNLTIVFEWRSNMQLVVRFSSGPDCYGGFRMLSLPW